MMCSYRSDPLIPTQLVWSDFLAPPRVRPRKSAGTLVADRRELGIILDGQQFFWVGKRWAELAMQTRHAYNASEAWCGRKWPGRSELHSKGTTIATRLKHGRSSFES